MRHPFGQPSQRRVWLAAWITLGTTFLFAAPSIAAGQAAQTASITGRVTDARSNDPVPNATIQVEGTRLAGLAGPDGRYRIANVREIGRAHV